MSCPDNFFAPCLIISEYPAYFANNRVLSQEELFCPSDPADVHLDLVMQRAYVLVMIGTLVVWEWRNLAREVLRRPLRRVPEVSCGYCQVEAEPGRLGR